MFSDAWPLCEVAPAPAPKAEPKAKASQQPPAKDKETKDKAGVLPAVK